MQLTGKTEQQFKEWLFKSYPIMIFKWGSFFELNKYYKDLPEVCQLALMQEFFRTECDLDLEPYATACGYRWSICKSAHEENISGGTSVCNSEYDGPTDGGGWFTHSEALKAAISKANDINNGR